MWEIHSIFCEKYFLMEEMRIVGLERNPGETKKSANTWKRTNAYV